MRIKGFNDNFLITRIFVVLILMSSCGDGRNKKEEVLTHGQMTQALIEVYLAEQKVNRFGIPRDSAEVHFRKLSPGVLEKIGISDTLFKKSFNHYMDRPKELELIYTAVVDSLSLMEQRLQVPAQ